jgi:peroxiredoxin
MKRLGAIVLGISKDSIASHKKFAEKFNLPFVLLSDPKAEVMKKYQAFGKKMMYGKTVDGTIRSTLVIGSKGNVIKHWPTVKKADQHRKRCWLFYGNNRTKIDRNRTKVSEQSGHYPVVFPEKPL